MNEMKKPLSATALLLMLAVHASAQQGPGLPGTVAREPGPPTRVFGALGWEEPGMPSTTVPPQLADVTFEQRLNDRLPLDARFRDETGRAVTLRAYFGKRPVVLAFVYYQCPMLCTQVMNGVSSALKVVPFTPGQDFDVVFISFDPRDTPQAAAEKKTALLADYQQTGTAAGWHFLTGDETSIRQVTSAAGFSYRWDDATGQFAHVSGVLVATADGRLSRYFYGIEYSPRELRMALVESGDGKIGSAVDKLLLYCYHYNPATGRYGAIAMNVVRLGGAVTVLFLGGFIFLMRRREVAHS
jgi:protein SCO1/2